MLSCILSFYVFLNGLHATNLKVDSHWTRRHASHYDAGQIQFVGISAMRAHRIFSWMRHDASEMKKSIFDATLCFRTVDKVTEVRQNQLKTIQPQYLGKLRTASLNLNFTSCYIKSVIVT